MVSNQERQKLLCDEEKDLSQGLGIVLGCATGLVLLVVLALVGLQPAPQPISSAQATAPSVQTHGSDELAEGKAGGEKVGERR